jgi:ABC-type branched-subunit amino acid transport system substrate-binding protein
MPARTARRVTLLLAPWPFIASVMMTGGACHVFDKLSNCSSDANCPLGQTCNTSGSFCELDTGPIVVGVTLPLSGQLQDFGQAMATMVQFAETYLNQAAGPTGIFGGRTIHFNIVDDQGDDNVALQQVQGFITGRVAAVIGPIISSQCELTEPVTGAAQVLEITPSAGATQLQTLQPAMDRYFFQTITSIGRGTAPAMTMYSTCPAPGRQPCHRLGILHSDDVTGQDYASTITAFAPLRDASVVVDVPVPTDQLAVSAYADAAAAFFAPNPDCGELIVLSQVACNFFRAVMQIQALPPSSFWIGYSGLDTTDFISACTITTDLADGVSGADDDFAPPRYQYAELLKVYNEGTNQSPPLSTLPPYSPNIFDAAAVIALAIAEAGGVSDRVAIRNGLWAVTTPGSQPVFSPRTLSSAFDAVHAGNPIKYTGASSDIDFNPYGVCNEGTEVWQIQHQDGGPACEAGSCDSIVITGHFPETLPDLMEAGTAQCPCPGDAGADACP